MDLNDVQRLIKLVNKGNLTEFQWKNEDFEIFIKTEKANIINQVVAPVSGPISAPIPSAQVQNVPAMASTESAVPDSLEAAKESASKGNLLEIRSPIVGTFYRASSPDKPPHLKVGDKVAIGDVVCIVEAMKLFNEIESEISGTVVQVMIEDASPVEYDQVLFLVEP